MRPTQQSSGPQKAALLFCFISVSMRLLSLLQTLGTELTSIRTLKFIAAISACVVAFHAFAGPSVTPFYLDKNYLPVVRVDWVSAMPEGVYAILALYALQNGAGCEGRNENGLQCKLTAELGFPSQCSAEHIALVRRWFDGPIPRMNTRATEKELKNPREPGALEALCYGQPDTASWQNIWEIISFSNEGKIVRVKAIGRWSSPNGRGKFSYTTEFWVGPTSIRLLSNIETHRD